MNMRLTTFTVLSLLGLSQAMPAHAAVSEITTTVTKTMVSAADIYGGCMAALAAAPPNCGLWVSFSCTGTYNSKDLAFYMLDQAQLALSLNKQVYVQVDNLKLHNTYCAVRRIDVIK